MGEFFDSVGERQEEGAVVLEAVVVERVEGAVGVPRRESSQHLGEMYQVLDVVEEWIGGSRMKVRVAVAVDPK